MSGPNDSQPRFAILSTTAKMAAAVAFLAYCTSSWLSETALHEPKLARLAAATWRGADEPTTTGSIAQAAGSTRLDPCAVPRGVR